MDARPIKFSSKVLRRNAIDSGSSSYSWLPIGPGILTSPGSKPGRASDVWKAAQMTLASLTGAVASVEGKECDIALGTLQPAATAPGAVGLHISLLPQRHDAILDLCGCGALDVEFMPQKLCRWTTLSQWDAEQGKRVPRSLAAMLDDDHFRTLHVTGDGKDVQTALFVVVGSLSATVATACIEASSVRHEDVHVTVAAQYQPAIAAASPTDASTAQGDQTLALPSELVEALRSFASIEAG